MKRFCDYLCEFSDPKRADFKACGQSGVYCTILEETLDKNAPCPVEDGLYRSRLTQFHREASDPSPREGPLK